MFLYVPSHEKKQLIWRGLGGEGEANGIKFFLT